MLVTSVISPLAVSVMTFGEYPDTRTVDIAGSGRGWRFGGEVDGVAWLRLVPTGGETRIPINVRLFGDFEPGVRVSVVRGPGDLAEGIMTVSREPYTLWAPTVATLRVEGRCRIHGAEVSYPEQEFIGGDAVALGLPFGLVGPSNAPLYIGLDDGGGLALDRVHLGAPRLHAPHEPPTPPEQVADPAVAAEAEVNRVMTLVQDGGLELPLRDELEKLLNTPHDQRFEPAGISDVIVASPKATSGTRRPLESILAASGDPGIARWLGFAGLLDPSMTTERIASITVAGRWLVPTRAWARWLERHSDEQAALGPLLAAGVNDIRAGTYDPAVVTSVYLWAQACVDLSMLPDPPVPPVIRPAPRGIWTFRGGQDVVRLPIAFDRVVPLAQGGLVRVDTGSDELVLPPQPGFPGRLRPLLITDDTGVDLIVEVPNDDGSYLFAAWQADMFGRWSDRSADTEITADPRPGLPVPEVNWIHDSARPGPTGEDPHSQGIRVRVAIPPRRSGEPSIVAVSVGLSDGSIELAAVPPTVEVVLDAPPLLRAQSTDEQLSVAFVGDDGSRRDAPAIPIEFVDPRPPFAPDRPPVLFFADPPDRSGTAGWAVPLAPAAGIDGWRVFVTTEARLAAAAAADGLPLPAAGLTRNDRAQHWLDHQAQLRRDRFECLTPTVIPGGAPFTGTLPGTSTDILFVRPVPSRRNVEPPFSSCPMIAIAVPLALTPTAPELELDRTGDPAVLRLRTRPGVVGADRYRLRATASATADPRLGIVVGHGDFDGTEAEIEPPALLPFARAFVSAEVRAVAEEGVAPVPVLWSPASAPIELHEVPRAAPTITDTPSVVSAGGDLVVTVRAPAAAASPVPGPYEVRLYVRPSAGSPWRSHLTAPVADGVATVTFTPATGAAYQVLVVDPIGRASEPVELAIP